MRFWHFILASLLPIGGSVDAFPHLELKTGLNILGIVVFSIVFGLILGSAKDKVKTMIKFFQNLELVIMKMVTLVIWLSPVGIMFLIAGQIVGTDNFIKQLENLGLYMATVLSGLFIHGCIVLPTILYLVSRINPLRFTAGLMQALLTALGTSSSSATMPITLRCLEENIGISPTVTRFVIPLGATINMDGTALYEAVAAIYIAQVRQMHLNFGHIILVSITATLASIGAAGIPQAGLVTMIMVLTAVGLPAELFVLIIPIDWFLDRIRTTINVFGDSVGTAVVERLCGRHLKETNMEPPSREEAYAMKDIPHKNNNNFVEDQIVIRPLENHAPSPIPKQYNSPTIINLETSLP